EVTVRQLMTHTSGLADHAKATDGDKWLGKRPADAIPTIAAGPMQFPPGSRFGYANANFLVLGLVVEKVTGRPLGDVLSEVVFRPAGMTAASLDCGHIARGYARKDKGFGPAQPFIVPDGDGSASVCSTAQDLARFEDAFVAGQLVRPETVKQMYTRQKLKDGTEIPFGLGMELVDFYGHRESFNIGGGSGFDTRASHFHDEDTSVAVGLTTAGGLASRLTFYTGRAILRLPPLVLAAKPLPAGEADAYIGDYKFDVPGFTLHVYKKGDDLWARVNDPDGERLTFLG